MEKVNLILDLQNKGTSRNEIKDILGYKRLDSMTKYMRNRGYKVVNDRYVIDDNSNIDVIIKKDDSCNTNVISNKNDECNINVINDPLVFDNISDELKLNIIDLARNYNDINEMINWFKNKGDDKYITDVIEINNGIEINLPKAPIKRTTIRVNEEVWNQFQSLADDNPQYDKHDLLSQAILLFVEKFKK